jgi:hypothetical protein
VLSGDLLDRFGQVSDGRQDRGRAHPVAIVLTLCAAAVVAGMASFTAIAAGPPTCRLRCWPHSINAGA